LASGQSICYIGDAPADDSDGVKTFTTGGVPSKSSTSVSSKATPIRLDASEVFTWASHTSAKEGKGATSSTTNIAAELSDDDVVARYRSMFNVMLIISCEQYD
jgi:hypothetical protein